MPKRTIELDTPFKRGEKVQTVRALPGIPEGTAGKIRLVNGLSDISGGSPWLRYWIRFNDGSLKGQVSHDDLVRPAMLDAWKTREIEREEMAARSADEAAAATEAAASSDGGGDGGAASLIPADLLERSKAAKARLLGG
ncbi:MAG: hypothetical protein ACRBI6_03195 [Acidimicrobiales bacterium]